MTDKVYLVKGSEDGNIAMYGSKEAAIERAIQYVLQSDPQLTITDLSISRYKWHVFVRHENTNIEADVETFEVHRK